MTMTSRPNNIRLPVIFVEVVPLSLQVPTANDGDGDGDYDAFFGDDVDSDVWHHNSTIANDNNNNNNNPPMLTNFSVHQYFLRCQNSNDNYDDHNGNHAAGISSRRERLRRRRYIPSRPWFVRFESNAVDGNVNINIKNDKTKTQTSIENENSTQDEPHHQVISGYLQHHHNDDGESSRQAADAVGQDHESSDLHLPIVWIPSDDPLQIKPIPCIVKAYVHRNHFDNVYRTTSTTVSLSSVEYILPATIAPSTLFRIRSPCTALPSLSSSSQSFPPYPSWIERSTFLNIDLLGEEETSSSSSSHITSPDYNHNNNDDVDDDIIRCYDAHVVDELTLKLRRIASKTIKIGTTKDSLIHYRRQRSQLDRLRQCCRNHVQSLQNNNNNNTNNREPPKSSSKFSPSPLDSSWWWPPSLIVHSQNNCDGKTLLVHSILRQRLHCDRVHIIRAGPILAKYGVRADAALESQIHTAIVSAACHRPSSHQNKNSIIPSSSSSSGLPPPLCAIILDQLELFLPPRLSGKTSSGGDPSVAVVNAIASYLRNITSTMQRYSEFPYPVKNPLYNRDSSRINDRKGLRGSGCGCGGQVLPVRICLIGIVTCPDDGWRTNSQMTAGGTGGLDGDGGSIFNAMGVGGDIFRLPLLTDLGRFLALKSFFKARGLKLDDDDDAVATLEAFAGSCPWVKAGVFQKIVCRLVQIVDKKKSKVSFIECKDLVEAFESVRHDHFGIPRTPSYSHQNGNVDERTKAPSKQIQSSSSTSHFGSVGGAVKAKAALEDALALDPRKRKLLKQFGLRPPSGVLLYGPPGTGKTLLAKSVAEMINQGNDNNLSGSPVSRTSVGRGGKFISLNISDIVSSEVGTSEKTLASTFEYADQNAPAVIFLDEFQALFTDRNSGGSGRLTTTLLQCLDDIHRWNEANEDVNHEQQKKTKTDNISRVTVIAATNTPWMIDTAFLRSGRFDRVVQVGLPTFPERESIFLVHARRMRIQNEDDDNDRDHAADGADVRSANLQSLARFVANETNGYSGADIAALCRAAAVRALIANGPNAYVTRDHFKVSLSSGEVGASSDAKLIRRLESWRPGRTAAK